MEQNISYYAHEGMLARMERVNHRQFVVIIILIVCLVASNLAWIIYEQQYESYTEQEVTQDTGTGNGSNNFVGGDFYGETNSQNP